jgi:hypothetical protein
LHDAERVDPEISDPQLESYVNGITEIQIQGLYQNSFHCFFIIFPEFRLDRCTPAVTQRSIFNNTAWSDLGTQHELYDSLASSLDINKSSRKVSLAGRSNEVVAAIVVLSFALLNYFSGPLKTGLGASHVGLPTITLNRYCGTYLVMDMVHNHHETYHSWYLRLVATGIDSILSHTDECEVVVRSQSS